AFGGRRLETARECPRFCSPKKPALSARLGGRGHERLTDHPLAFPTFRVVRRPSPGATILSPWEGGLSPRLLPASGGRSPPCHQHGLISGSMWRVWSSFSPE